MPYNPREFWINSGKTYFEKFDYNKRFKLQEEMLIDYLKNQEFTSVLELGCGFGRITKILLDNFPNIENYLCVDVSIDQIENAKTYIRESNNRDKVRFIESDIQGLNVNEKFDLVLASEVLLHVLPAEINMVIQKMISMSKLHVINIDWYEDRAPKVIAEHNFLHKYLDIYKSVGGTKEIKRFPLVKKSLFSNLDTKQSLFHAII